MHMLKELGNTASVGVAGCGLRPSARHPMDIHILYSELMDLRNAMFEGENRLRGRGDEGEFHAAYG